MHQLLIQHLLFPNLNKLILIPMAYRADWKRKKLKICCCRVPGVQHVNDVVTVKLKREGQSSLTKPLFLQSSPSQFMAASSCQLLRLKKKPVILQGLLSVSHILHPNHQLILSQSPESILFLTISISLVKTYLSPGLL